jgi:MFS family permease
LQDPKSRIGVFVGLCWIYTCIHLDRQILGILANSVKSNFDLSDQQLGTLTGSAFSIVYALLGLHFGSLADRGNRLRLAAIGAWIWSLSSIGGAFATGYPGLVASRAGVALGEAVATAATVSLIAEIAGEKYRGRAAGVFFACAFLGAGTAAIAGGAIVDCCNDLISFGGWRIAMVAAGLPGIAGALYLGIFHGKVDVRNSVRLPPHRARLLMMATAASLFAVLVQMRWQPSVSVPISISIAVLYGAGWVRSQWRFDRQAFLATLGKVEFRWLLLAFAAVLFVDYGATFWLLPFAQRRFGVTAGRAGADLGLLLIVGGILGCLFGGWVADRWHRLKASGRVWTAMIAVIAEAAAIVVALRQTEYTGFVVAFGIFCISSGGWTGVAAAIGFDIVPREHRGSGTALYFLVTTVFGAGLGPFAIGLVSDRIGSLGLALTWACAVMVVGALALARLSLLIERPEAG